MSNLTNNILENIAILETLIDDANDTNTAKLTQREILFHDTLNDIIAEYITVKTDVSYADYLNEIFDDLYSSTEKTSIIGVLEIIENSLINSNIKHDIITYENARLTLELNEFITTAQLNKAKKEDDYNKALKAIIKIAKNARNEKILNDNEKMTAFIAKMSINEIVKMQDVAKIIKAQKVADDKKAKKAKK